MMERVRSLRDLCEGARQAVMKKMRRGAAIMMSPKSHRSRPKPMARRCGASPSPLPGGSARAANDLEVEVADLLAQGVPIDAEELRRPDLVAAGGGERGADQRRLDLPQDPVIEPGRRQHVAIA